MSRKVKLNLFAKIFLNFFFLAVLVIGGISIISYYKSSSILKAGAEEKLNAIVQEKVNLLGVIIKNSIATGEMFASQPTIRKQIEDVNATQIKSINWDNAGLLQDGFELGRGLYENIFITAKDGLILQDGLNGVTIGTDLGNLEWYQETVKGKVVFSKVMISGITGMPVVTVGMPVVNTGTLAERGVETIGVAGITINLKMLTKPITDTKIGKTGFTFISNRDGLVLAHPDSSKVMNLDFSKEPGMSEISKRMHDEEAGVGTYILDGQEKMMYFYHLPDSDWVVGSVIATEEVLNQVNQVLWQQIIAGVVALVIGLIVAALFARDLTAPIGRLVAAMGQASEGNLNCEVQINRADELGTLAQAFKKMMDDIRGIINQINATSQSVAATSEELSSNAEEASKATQQVANTIGEVAKDSANQAQSVTEIVQVMDQMAQSIHQVAAGAGEQSKNVITTTEQVNDMVQKIQIMAEGMENVRQAALQSGVIAENGGKAVKKTVEGMIKVKESAFETANKINELGEESQKIGQIIEVIDEIAEQTNLLALNAAIEAARAGEHGKGFAVVADEVRKLAERSGKATKEIAQLIADIQNGTLVAVDSMRVGTIEVEQGVALAQEAGKSLSEIVDGINTTGENVQQIMEIINDILAGSQEVSHAVDNVAAITEENTAATEEMSASATEVNLAMQNVASISEGNASAAEEVSASTEELTASIEEISASSEQLAIMAQELQNAVAKFRV
ncbi:MAG: methyl-accepting chemotaxis protein [Thermincola sp.]|jgi:methyl-accepting chemotaxis protein|nr:methyl-accepting chemotaxis protein [Thermincola sp.]MDT3702436.1 methyl-accepting chemotaxis protein [Thermincola sp.]